MSEKMLAHKIPIVAKFIAILELSYFEESRKFNQTFSILKQLQVSPPDFQAIVTKFFE